MRITARTRVFAVLGEPVAHSLSPRMQNAGFQAAGLDAVYVALQPDAETLVAQMATLVHTGGGGNITIPYKPLAATAPATRDDRVERLGCANVFGGALGGLHVANTDVDGVLAALRELRTDARAWCVIGTGGSARAVVGAAGERGARLSICSRAPSRAAAFGEWAASLGVAAAALAECGVVINATPLGLSPGDRLPLDPDQIPHGAAALDLVYLHDRPTAWVHACERRGIRAADGREVLLAQGAASWRHWFPDVKPPIEVMRAAVDGRLG